MRFAFSWVLTLVMICCLLHGRHERLRLCRNQSGRVSALDLPEPRTKDSKKRSLREEPFSSFSSLLGRTLRNSSWRNIARVRTPRFRTKLAFEIAAVMIIRGLLCSKKRLATRNNLWTLVAVHFGSVQKHHNSGGESGLTLRTLVQIGPLHILAETGTTTH